MSLFIHVGRPMERHNDEMLVLQAEFVIDGRTNESWAISQESVYHHVANMPNFLLNTLVGILVFGQFFSAMIRFLPLHHYCALSDKISVSHFTRCEHIIC